MCNISSLLFQVTVGPCNLACYMLISETPQKYINFGKSLEQQFYGGILWNYNSDFVLRNLSLPSCEMQNILFFKKTFLDLFRLIFTIILASTTILIMQLNDALIAQISLRNNASTNSTFVSWAFGQNLDITYKYSFSKNLKLMILTWNLKFVKKVKKAYM